MQGDTDPFPPDLAGLSRADWLAAMGGLAETHGFSEPLGRAQHAFFVERGDTLVVSFETLPAIEQLSPTRTPIGFDMVGRAGWSGLSVLASHDTWFRSDRVHDFFDQLTDDGFFDDFDTVLFFGAGPCGYAAAAHSVASPGARVLVLQPQATLDPDLADWDDRFIEQRRLDFRARYGFAPEMVEGALATHVFYDPRERLDAMHAALFARPGVSRYRLPFMGGSLLAEMRAMNLLEPLLEAAAEDRLDRRRVSEMMRTRRTHPPYLRRLLARLDAEERTGLVRMLCQNVTTRMSAPRFRRRLEQIDAEGAPDR